MNNQTFVKKATTFAIENLHILLFIIAFCLFYISKDKRIFSFSLTNISGILLFEIGFLIAMIGLCNMNIYDDDYDFQKIQK